MDPANIETMPLDLLKQFAMKLPFDDIQHYCETSKRFRQICSDPYFWKALYERDFQETMGPETMGPETMGPETMGPETTGEETTNTRPIDDYRGFYLYLVGKDLVYQGLVIESDYNYEGSIGNLVDNIAIVDDIIQDLQRQINRRRQEIFEEVDKDIEKARSFKEQGTRLLNNNLRKRSPRYFFVANSEVFTRLRATIPDGTRSVPIWPIIDELEYHGFSPDLRDGDLVGIYQSVEADLTKLPNMIIYIFRDEDGQLKATQSGRTILPHRLLEEMKEKGITAQAITEQYDLPFDISDIDK